MNSQDLLRAAALPAARPPVSIDLLLTGGQLAATAALVERFKENCPTCTKWSAQEPHEYKCAWAHFLKMMGVTE